MTENQRLLTLTEVAALLGVCRRTVYRQLLSVGADGSPRLKAVCRGRRKAYRRRDVEVLAEKGWRVP